MADQRLTSLTAISAPASGDKIYIVDVSDTTDDASGSSRLITYTNLMGSILDTLGITASVAEINVLDGIPVTLTATELGYVDGVTSAIQTQLNAKAPLASPTFTGTVTLPVGLTGVIRADSGVVSVDSDVTDIVAAASTTAAGKVELAIASEINTGTDDTRAVTPDSFAGSNFGIRYVAVVVFGPATDISTGDGKAFFHIPPALNGMNLVYAHGAVFTAGTTNSTTVQVHNLTQTADMLTALIEIETGEVGSDTASPGVTIDTNNDDVATNDRIRIDVDSVSTTEPLGLVVTLGFQLP